MGVRGGGRGCSAPVSLLPPFPRGRGRGRGRGGGLLPPSPSLPWESDGLSQLPRRQDAQAPAAVGRGPAHFFRGPAADGGLLQQPVGGPSMPDGYSRHSTLPQSHLLHHSLLDMMGDAADAAPLGPGMCGGSGTDVLPGMILSQGSAAGPAPPERPTAAPAFELNMLANAAASQPAPLPVDSRSPPLTMTTEPAPVIPEGQCQLAFASPHFETGDATGPPRRLGLVSRPLQSRIDAGFCHSCSPRGPGLHSRI